MRIGSWLKKAVPGGSRQRAQADQDQQVNEKHKETAAFLNDLCRELKIDRGTAVYLAAFLAKSQRDMMAGRYTPLGKDATLEELAAEAAFQGFLDPQAQGAEHGTVLRDDLLMRVLVHYARQGNASARSAAKRFAAGELKKRSRSRGTEQALRMARKLAD